jgi:hypothetical protein
MCEASCVLMLRGCVLMLRLLHDPVMNTISWTTTSSVRIRCSADIHQNALYSAP